MPVREYLNRQGRFAHFLEEDIEYFQAKVDEMWENGCCRVCFPSPKNSHRCSNASDVGLPLPKGRTGVGADASAPPMSTAGVFYSGSV